MKTRTALTAAALLAFAPVTAAVAVATDPLAEVDAAVDDDADDGDGGYWGLLGLLGLFGPLLGPKRRDNDVHVHRTTTTGRNDGNPLT